MSRSLGRISAAAAGLAALVGTLVAGAPSASAQPNGSEYPSVSNPDKCLATNGQVAQLGAPAILWECNYNPDQRWTFIAAGEGYDYLRNDLGYCLDIPFSSMDRGVQAIQWDCNNGHNQQWKVEYRPDSQFRLRNRVSGLCLDIEGNNSGTNGARLIQWDCHNGDNQLWAF
ncbi:MULTISPECIES: RICIN domain-containing protein [Streptomyces]|uniref:RICIN domain-containing protein n=1 Tax=Streptomyces TaxID=1883 RepID=UPI000466148E|nr:RICIN domain-containing protein [Streptomyces exfoliatus]